LSVISSVIPYTVRYTHKFYTHTHTHTHTYIYIYMCLFMCVVQYNYIVGREVFQIDIFAKRFPTNSTHNTLVIRMFYLLHPTFSIYFMTRKIFSTVRIMNLLTLQTPTTLRYVVLLKEIWRSIFGIILHSLNITFFH